MAGRDPKPPEQRRRRNKTPEPVKLSAGAKPKSAPELAGSADLLESTRSYWQTIWASPMAAVWLAADVPALTRLAGLVDQVGRGEATGTVLSEIRQLEDRFGLSPLARRRLQWELAAANASRAGEPQPDPPAGPIDDDERWLRAV